MLDIAQSLGAGFATALQPLYLYYALLGTILGTITGVLPGLGPLGAMAILLGFTLTMDPTGAIILFAGIYYGAMYGGSTTSILLNIPGEAASVVTCIDGYKMTQKGRGGAALTVAAVGSFIAGTISILGLVVVTVTGFVCIVADRLLGGSGIAGAAASSTAGNSAAVPQAVALADKSFAPVAEAATVQVAASVIVTAIFTPLLTSWWFKRVKRTETLAGVRAVDPVSN